MILAVEAPHAAHQVTSPIARAGQAVDAILIACGLPQPPGPWPAPSAEQVAEARRMQLDPPTRRVN